MKQLLFSANIRLVLYHKAVLNVPVDFFSNQQG
jgi:hypothetical protein